jgi:hypothetical protein
MAIAIPATLVEVRARLFGRRLIYALLALITAVVVAIVLGLVAPQRFASVTDLRLLAHLVTTTPRWSDPALATPYFTLTMEHEALIGAVLAIAAAVALVRVRERRASEKVTAWAFVVLAIVIGLPFLNVADPQGLAFRLRVAAFVPLAMCGAVLTGAIKLPRYALPVIALVLALRGLHERTEGRIVAHPALVAGAMAAGDHVAAGQTIIVPERHIAFMVAWYSRKPVSLRPEPVPVAQRIRLVPLAFIGPGSPLEHAIDDAREAPGIAPPIGVHPRHKNGLVLIPEATWQWILARLPERDRRHFAQWPTI